SPRPQETVGLTDTTAAPPQPDRKPTLERLKRRADFLRIATGIRRVTAGLTLEMAPMPERNGHLLRVGFTASRKIGGAVERNRAKRRLRAAAQAVLPLYGLPGNDYVLVARRETLASRRGGCCAAMLSPCSAARRASIRCLLGNKDP